MALKITGIPSIDAMITERNVTDYKGHLANVCRELEKTEQGRDWLASDDAKSIRDWWEKQKT